MIYDRQAVKAWMHPDGRVVPASTMDAAKRDGGAMQSSLAGYTIPLHAGQLAPADAEPYAWAVSGGGVLHLGPHAEDDARVYASRCEIGTRAFPLYRQAAPAEPEYVFQIGESYETQGGERVTVESRDAILIECSDGMYRYDRKGNPADAGRVTGTPHDYSFRGNFKRAAAPNASEGGLTL